VVRLFAGAILLVIVSDPATPGPTDLDATSIEEFAAGIAAGALLAGRPDTTLRFAKIMLRSFLDGMPEPETVRALEIVRG
jgi:hypothetical protein